MNFVDFLKSNLTIEKKDLRSEIELQFRYRLYMDPAFPFLISLGINNLFQGFRDKEFGFVGIIHLWWGWKNNHILYDIHIKSSVLNSGFWHSKWLNSQEEAIKLSKKIESRNILDNEKMVFVHQYWLKIFKK